MTYLKIAKGSAAALVILAGLALAFSGCAGGGDSGDDSGGPVADDTAADDTAASDDTSDDSGDDDADGVRVYQDGDDLVIENEFVSVRYHLSLGRFEIRDGEGNTVLKDAANMILSHAFVPKHQWSSAAGYQSGWTSADAANALGAGKSATVTRSSLPGAPDIETTFTVLEGKSCVLARVRAVNSTDAKMKIGSIYPIFADGVYGYLNFGDRGDLRTLTNGTLSFADFTVPIVAGAVPSLSNWSALIYNQASGKSLMLGYLSYEAAQPVVYNGPTDDRAAQSFQVNCEYQPQKILDPGEGFESETMILDFGQDTPFDALETYANRVKAWLGITTWIERHPEIGVPVGWNSWSGSGSSGGYGTNINEAVITDNMDFADRELRRWGMNYFQIDDGWQVITGDWEVNEARFPDHGDQNGIEWLLSRAKSLGFHTGVWVQGFQADYDSQTFLNHPEWFADPLLGGIFGDEEAQLDLSNPDALAHLTEVMQTLREWGVEWVKLDFGYREMLSTNWDEPNLSNMEYYRRGVKTVREAIGPDVFFLNVAIVGPTYDLINACRITLDTMPVWEGEADDPYSPISFFDNQGLKPMYRDAVRRYYLQNRVWINHPDLIFFRAHADPDFPPLTLEQSRTFTTAVALQGGLVKLGDRLVDLAPEAVDVIRRIIPPQPNAARPLDMFRREFPEAFSLPVADFDEPYHVVGLLNWGWNRDMTVWPYREMASEEHEIGVDFEEAGLDPADTYLAFEFWTQEYLGEVSGDITLSVPADSPRVVTMRKPLGRPQLLGENRHVLGGVGVIRSIAWDDSAKTLTGVQEGAVGTPFAPFTHRLTFYVPDGFEADTANVAAPAGYEIANKTLDILGNIATLNFDVLETDPCGAGEVCTHPDVTWSIEFRGK